MRKLLLITSVLFSSIASFAQVNIDSAWMKGSQWVETFLFSPGHNGTLDGISYTIADDSLINGVSYRMVSGKYMGQKIFGYAYNPPIYSNPNLPATMIGGIRVDGKKVYFIRTSDSMIVKGYPINYASEFPLGTEKMIYDFDIEAGDTLSWKSATENIVLSIDTVTFCDGRKAKRYKFNNDVGSLENYWIEGVGSVISPLGQEKYAKPTFGQQTTHLLCYYSTNYCFSMETPQAKGCFYIPPNSIKDEIVFDPVFSVTNPIQGNVIELKNDSRISFIAVYDISGKEKFRSDKVLESGTHSLPFAAEPGLYIIKVQFANGIVQQKKLIRL